MKKIGDGNKVYLAYGSNLNLEQMGHRCPYAIPLGTAVLEDYRLLFRGGNQNAVATVESEAGCSVPVLLWEITPRDEQALDVYEGWPRLYRKETVSVMFEGKQVEAMVYIMNAGELGAPSKYYLNTIWQGYLSAGFESDPLNEAVRYSTPVAEPTRNKIAWSRERCIEAVECFIKKHDRFPRTEDFLKNSELPLPPTFKHHMQETIGEYLKRHPSYDAASERYAIGRFTPIIRENQS